MPKPKLEARQKTLAEEREHEHPSPIYCSANRRLEKMGVHWVLWLFATFRTFLLVSPDRQHIV